MAFHVIFLYFLTHSITFSLVGDWNWVLLSSDICLSLIIYYNFHYTNVPLKVHVSNAYCRVSLHSLPVFFSTFNIVNNFLKNSLIFLKASTSFPHSFKILIFEYLVLPFSFDFYWWCWYTLLFSYIFPVIQFETDRIILYKIYFYFFAYVITEKNRCW